ncbi:MAG: flagellar filament capping protein FliD [Armatimonadota bacterium]|nr:flagellar filament capping protein FliD [Armatimonadota bacterium]
MPGTMSVSGLVSGLKTDEIIAKVMEYAARPKARLQSQKAEMQQRLAAWQDINTRLLALKVKSESIADLADFQAMTASTSDSNVMTATASTGASPGVYYIKVISKAQSHQVSSQAGAYTSVNDIVGTGTVRIALANGTSFEVNVDSANNTLSGLANLINKADKGVKATIVNAGTASSPDYRLILTSAQAGTENRMTSVDTSGLTGGTAPVFDLDNPLQAASSAVLEIGEGSGKITVIKDSNTVTDLIPGVTLNILSADSTKTIRIEVSADITSIRKAIENFVEQYNDVAKAIGSQFDYDSTTGETPPLFADFRLQTVQADIVSTLTGRVSGLTSSLNALATIGITQDTTGQLVIDYSTLDSVLQNNLTQVARVFGAGIESSSAHITFLASTADTKPSGNTGWQVEVIQPARRAQVTAGVAMLEPLSADETLYVNGKSIRLTAGMSIDEVVAVINSYSNQTSVVALKTGADGTGEGNYITFRHLQYGSAYKVTVVSSRSLSGGGTTGVGIQLVSSDDPAGESGQGQGLTGLDVAGTINGETAVGRGQILTLRSNQNANPANGLSLLVTATEPLSGAKVVFTKGVGTALRELLNAMTSATGAVSQAQSSLNDAISKIDAEIADWDTRLSEQEARLYDQFNRLEAQLAKLQQQGNYISAQLAALSGSKK